MFMKVHKDLLPKATSLLLGTGDGIGANMHVYLLSFACQRAASCRSR
jgi:hypothetical protein